MAEIETNSEGYGTDPEATTTNTIFEYNEEITEAPEEGLVTQGAALLSSQMEPLEENNNPGQPKTGDSHFQMIETTSGILEGEGEDDQNTGLFDDTQVFDSNEPYERSAWSRTDLEDVREQDPEEYTQYNQKYEENERF